MELLAAINALEALKRPSHVDLHTDSQYVKNGIMSWIHGWKRNGWKTADKKPCEECRTLAAADTSADLHEITWHWSRVMPAIPRTSGPTNWPARAWRRSSR